MQEDRCVVVSDFKQHNNLFTLYYTYNNRVSVLLYNSSRISVEQLLLYYFLYKTVQQQQYNTHTHTYTARGVAQSIQSST